MQEGERKRVKEENEESSFRDLRSRGFLQTLKLKKGQSKMFVCVGKMRETRRKRRKDPSREQKLKRTK